MRTAVGCQAQQRPCIVVGKSLARIEVERLVYVVGKKVKHKVEEAHLAPALNDRQLPVALTQRPKHLGGGNVHFCIMGINEPQKVGDWAYDDINGSSAEWKLGAYHFPIYPAIPEGQNDDGYPWLRKAVESLDLIFEGHEHTLARTAMISVFISEDIMISF